MRQPGIPDSLWKLLDEVNPAWRSDVKGNSRRVVEAFSAVLASGSTPGQVKRNVSYGPHARQVLDVYYPPAAKHPVPVLIFAHGGAFVDGEKDRTPEIYGNVCRFMVRNGMLGINLEYRLAPEIRFPAATEDVAAAVAWTRREIAAYGGDPERIFLFGHSAGAMHVGLYAYDRRSHPPEGSGIAGLVVLSGRVRAENLAENPNAKKVETYYGTDQALMEQGSLVTHLHPGVPPTLVGFAEYESALIDLHCIELIHRLTMLRRRSPPFFRLARHNHTSTVAQIDTADDQVGPRILDFIRSVGY